MADIQEEIMALIKKSGLVCKNCNNWTKETVSWGRKVIADDGFGLCFSIDTSDGAAHNIIGPYFYCAHFTPKPDFNG